MRLIDLNDRQPFRMYTDSYPILLMERWIYGALKILLFFEIVKKVDSFRTLGKNTIHDRFFHQFDVHFTNRLTDSNELWFRYIVIIIISVTYIRFHIIT